MNQNNSGLVIAAIIIVVLGILTWWLWGGGNALPGMNNEMATSTATTSPVARTNRSSQDVVAIAESISGTSRFGALFISTGVASSIKATGKYTIFVPTDGAFNLLAPGSLDNMTAAAKKRLVQYHVVSGRVVDIDALVSSNITALSGDMLNFNIGPTDKVPRVNSSLIIAAYTGKNGIVYVVNNVLIPPKK